ncbi:MAG: hypothetical protein JSR76_01460 [Verrucomicrobia bacterium]|nr:hypothetical protein [Verrucomicrobiota bacterium]
MQKLTGSFPSPLRRLPCESSPSAPLEVLGLLSRLEGLELPRSFRREAPPLPSFVEGALDDRAKSVGYKAANLEALRAVGDLLGFSVPSFWAIGHEALLAHIKAQYPDFLKDYAKLQGLLLEGRGLSPEVKAILERIRGSIERVFIDHPFPITLASLEGKYLIVRSTGKEDSKTSSNAGGNESIAFIPKDNPRAVSENIGKVIASYFSEKSYGQRLSVGDKTVFEEPFVPVLLQSMVYGDTVLERSGVILVPSDDIARVAVVYGLAAGATDGTTPADRIYMPLDGQETVVVCCKDRSLRMQELDGGPQCTLTPVGDLLPKEPALSSLMLLQMRKIVEGLRRYYGYPLDIEFTIIGEKFYILQARPLITPPAKSPSYLADVADALTLSTIEDGGGYVRSIRSEKDVVVSADIEEAYAKFIAIPQDEKALVKTVIVKKTPVATSHCVVFLRSHGVAVLSMEASPPEFPYAVDPQQGCLQRGEGEVREGYIAFPIPLELSLRPTRTVLYGDVRGEVYEVLGRRLQAFVGEVKVDRAPFTIKDLKDLLTLMRQGSIEESKEASQKLIVMLCAYMRGAEILPETRRELLIVLEAILDVLEREFIPSLDGSSSLKKLYALRKIEALLFQTGRGIIGGLSFTRCLQSAHGAKAIARTFEMPLDGELLSLGPLVKVRNHFIQEEDKDLWDLFLRGSDLNALRSVQSFFSRLALCDSLTDVANLSIRPLLRASLAPAEVIEKLGTLARDFQEAVDLSLELQQIATEIEACRLRCRDPHYVGGYVLKLTSQIKTITEGPLRDKMLALSETSRGPVWRAYSRIVEVFDLTIKECTGSIEYRSFRLKAAHFHAFLLPYRDLTSYILSLVFSPDEEGGPSKVLVPAYMREVAPLGFPADCDETLAENFCRASPGFDVSLVTFALKASYTLRKPNFPETFEDMFTTCHRNMQEALHIAMANPVYEQILPAKQQAMRIYPSSPPKENSTGFFHMEGDTVEYKMPMQLLSEIHVEGSKITTKYHVPLRTHGAQLVVISDEKREAVSVEVVVYGGNENGRWGNLVRSVQFVDDIMGGYRSEAISTEYNCTFRWQLAQATETELLVFSRYVRAILHASADQEFKGFASALSGLWYGFSRKRDISMDFLRGLLLKIPEDIKWLKELEWMHRFVDVTDSWMRAKELLQIEPGMSDDTEYLQDEAIVGGWLEKDPNNLRYVCDHLKSLGACEAAVRKDPANLSYVPFRFQTLAMVSDAVTRGYTDLASIAPEFRVVEICRKIVEREPLNLEFVPLALQDTPMVEGALKKDGLLLRHVRSSLKTASLCEIALSQNPKALVGVPSCEQNEEMAERIIRINGTLLKHVALPYRTDKICAIAIATDVRSIAFVPEDKQTEEMAMAVVTKDGFLLRHVAPRLRTALVCKKALEEVKSSLRYVPPEIQTEEMALGCIEKVWAAIIWVAPSLLTEVVCRKAVEKNPRALEYIPSELQRVDMIRAALAIDLSQYKHVNAALQEEAKAICMEVLRGDPKRFKELHSDLQTEELVKAVLEIDGTLLKYVRPSLVTESLCELAVRQNSSALEFVPACFQSKGLVESVLVRMPGAIRWALPRFRTAELYKTALEKDLGLLRHIPYWQQELLFDHLLELFREFTSSFRLSERHLLMGGAHPIIKARIIEAFTKT